MPEKLPEKIERQIRKAGLPLAGTMPFDPRLGINKRGQPVLEKAPVRHGPKAGKRGYVDTQGRVWIRDRAHGQHPDHWDVQENGGSKGYIRVDLSGQSIALNSNGFSDLPDGSIGR